jgi:CDGSH-type Zn-finger protein
MSAANEVPVEIKVEADGPYEVTGNFHLVGADGEKLSDSERVFLCRCGHSANKPFCDGSHRKAGFTDPGVATAD